MEKVKKKYISLFIKYTQNNNILGASSPFLLLQDNDFIYKDVKAYLELNAEHNYKDSNIFKTEIKETNKKKNRMKFFVKGCDEQDLMIDNNSNSNNNNKLIDKDNKQSKNKLLDYNSDIKPTDNCLKFELEIKNVFENIFIEKINLTNAFKFSLNEIIAEFIVDCSSTFSSNFHSVLVSIIVELRNAYNNYGWKYIIQSLLESSELKKFVYNHNKTDENDLKNELKQIEQINSICQNDSNFDYLKEQIDLSNIKGAYHFLPNILDFFVVNYVTYILEDMDYVLILLVVNYFTDWCYFKNYLFDKLTLK